MNEELAKVYDPKAVEDRIYQMWIDGNRFHADVDKTKKPFSIVMPPPNVTGQLHLGHAFDCTLQDILVRTKRMQGYSALWLPGTDHAGIATQIKLEEKIRKEEGLTRYDLGREEFLRRTWEWKEAYGNRIVKQQKKLGSSCDWERSRFTMDEGCSKAVREVFVSLYEKGLIYKGKRITNWCPKCRTALSDAEVEYSEQAGHFWHIRYPIVGSDEYLIIATTRPETLLGDSALAVHPDDERYTAFVGKKVILPLVGREIPIVADEYVEKDFGTGVVKITPCHDPNDFEVGLRHNLEQILVLDNDAKINSNGGKYEGLDRYEARKQIVADLDAGGYLVKVEDHAHNVGACYRCGTTVEPMASDQWFVKMAPLAKEALRAEREGEVNFVPDRFSKIYENWMENVHDWCISRQLWWGHQIPAWYCDECGHTTVSREDATECEHCHSKKIHREEDVLDTWFSSALWPFSTLGWPEKTPELDYFYPTSVLVTGYDIIFFWVSRMVFSGLAHTGKSPFNTVLIHGLIRDSQGRKMSKSLGNGIDPLEVVDNYGADALRFTIATGNSPGNDARFYMERVEANRNFCNKIWNASRFVRMNLTVEDSKLPAVDQLRLEDKWILTKLNGLINEMTDNIERFELGVAASKIYDFFWDDFCDWYIELVKPRLNGGQDSENAQRVLCHVLSTALALLHPFMPFITEEIWQHLPHTGEALIVAKWPEFNAEYDFPKEREGCEAVIDIIRSIRNRRSEMNVPPSRKAHVYIVTEYADVFRSAIAPISKLASAGEVMVVSEAPEGASGMVSAVTGGATAYMPMADLIDFEAERARLNKELEKAEGELARVRGKLSNESFISRAPAQVVDAERAREAQAIALIANLRASLDALANA